MNRYIVLIIITFSLSIYAATKTEAPKATEQKIYTETEFQKKLQDELAAKIKKTSGTHMVEFSKELLDREDQLKARELELKKKEEELKSSMSDFQKKVVEFQDSQKKFLGCIDNQKENTDKRVTQMVEVISGMKPQSAADVLSIQDADLAVRIMSQLESAKASKIFNLMDKQVSAKLQKQFLDMKK